MENRELTFREKLYYILCINGGISLKAIRLMDGSASYKAKVLSNERAKGAISTKKALTTLCDIDSMGHYWKHLVDRQIQMVAVENTAQVKKRGDSVERSRRVEWQSEAAVIMLENDIVIDIKGLKGTPEGKNGDKREPQKGRAEIKGNQRRNTYYLSKDVKACKFVAGDEQAVRRARATGTLVTVSSEIYNIYVMGSGLISWEIVGETCYKEKSEAVGKYLEGERLTTKAICFTDSIRKIGDMLEPTKRFQQKTSIRAGQVYDENYVFPKTKNGMTQFIYLITPEIRAVVKRIVSSEVQKIREDTRQNGQVYWLNFLMPDIAKLKVFLQSVEYGKPSDQYIIYAYEEYEEILEEIAGKDCDIVTYKTEDIVEAVYDAVRRTN